VAAAIEEETKPNWTLVILSGAAAFAVVLAFRAALEHAGKR